MANFLEVERLALSLSEHERARLAGKLLESISGMKSREATGSIKLEQVDSSMMSAVGYDSNVCSLEVVFRTGEVYRYQGISVDEYNGLMNAESKGRYMQERIINHYPYEQVKN